MKKVTIQDVAKELNLSRNTVAKALNNSETVAYDTRYTVIKRAYEMGYSKLQPVVLNEFNIEEISKESMSIAVFARRELSTFWNRIIMGISDELNKHGCKMQFNFISEQDERCGVLAIDQEVPIDGVIVLSVFDKTYVERLIALEVPIVFLDAPEDISSTLRVGDIVLYEGANSVRSMTEHLIAQGAKRLGFIGDITYCRSICDRFHGFENAIEHAGLEIDKKLFQVEHKKNRYYIYNEVKEAIEAFPYIPDGIVCANDDIAKDVIECLGEKGQRVPEDVMVTGFDNKEESTYITPTITTAYIANQRMGRRLVQQLIWRIDNKEMPHEVVTLSTDVIYRESSIRQK